MPITFHPDGRITGNKIQMPAGSGSPGQILQVKHATKVDEQDVNSITPVALTSLAITLTPHYANSLIQIICDIATMDRYVHSWSVFQDGQKMEQTSISGTNNSGTNHNEQYMTKTFYHGANVAGEMDNCVWQQFAPAGSTSSRVYQVYATSGWSGTAYSMKINDRSSTDMSSVSRMSVFEIAQ